MARPEPMNASPHHARVNVSLALSDPVYVAGGHISGKMQVESRADVESLLGIGVMMVELYAIQELNSREHSATSTFIHSRRIFQGPGLPPSNAVHSEHVPGSGELPLPAHHYPARRGQTTFFFQFPIPASSPSSINFGPASVKYEIRASASVAWRGEICLVTDTRQVKVVESWDPTDAPPPPQAVAITEGGKIWAQATLTSGVVVGGESACIDLHLRNHTLRWTSGVTVTLTRHLHLSQSFLPGRSPDTSEIATQVEFRGPEYSVPPGIEGIARLVIDIPRHSRGVNGGPRVDDNGTITEGFFEVRCTLELRVDMPPESEDTVVILPLTIYHSVAVPQVPVSPPYLASSPYPYSAPVSPGLLSPPPGTSSMPVYAGNQQHDPLRMSPMQSLSDYSPDQHFEQEVHNRQDVPYPYASPIQRSIPVAPRSPARYYTPGLSTSYTPSPRLLPPTPTSYVHPEAPIETFGSYASPDHLNGAIASPTSQNFHVAAHQRSISPGPRGQPLPQSHALDQQPSLSRARPPPIEIPALPNPHDSQGLLHSPRPIPSPKHSFHGSVPKSDNVSKLERMADEVEKQTGDLSSDIPKGDAGVALQGPQGLEGDPQAELSVDKTLPAPPVPSTKERRLASQRPHVDTLFTTEQPMAHHPSFPSSTDHLPRAPPTPPIAAITPIKFPKAPTELSGLGANLGTEVPLESGLDALERRLLAEVGMRKFDAQERPHVRSVVQPIAIPPSGPPPDTVNDSAISSLTLADRDGVLKANLEREQEQDRDSDERTQHMGAGGHSPSEDDRDARTQKGKSSRRLGKSKHSEEDLERVGRRRERKKTRDEEGRKLRQEAKGRVAAWLGEIDASVPPVLDDPASFTSPTASHFVPISESASFGIAPAEMAEERPSSGGISADKDVSASPNPRSSGFVTISSLSAVVATRGSGDEAPSKPSPRRSSLNDARQVSTITTTAQRLPMPRSPSAEIKRSQPAESALHPPQRSPLFSPGRLPRFPLKPMDPEVKYDVRSARGGRGGRVTQVASIWAAKANPCATPDANANANAGASAEKGVPPPVPKKPKLPTPQAVRKPVLNVLKRSPVAHTGGPTPNRLREARTGTGAGVGLGITMGAGMGASTGAGPGASLGGREATKATTVPAIVSSSHAVPMLSSTASLARPKPHGLSGPQGQTPARSLPPMISETISDLSLRSKTGGGGGQGRALGELAFGQARLRDLIKKYQG